ncbi:MAG TPA: ankyrin repeat domain-containing protein [Jatrophihabitantaceae bacterium]
MALSEEICTSAFLAIRSGDVAALGDLLLTHSELAACRLSGAADGRTPLHVVTDWPGYFPNGPRIAELLVDSGAEVDSRGSQDGTGETPLQWTASNDDVDIARVLIDAGADVNAAGGSIGTVLDNAVGYGCWNVARLVVDRGARVDKLWLAAGLGLLEQLEVLLADPANSTQASVDQAFWHACAGGRRRAAEFLVQHGADLTFTPDYGRGTVLDVANDHGTQQSNVIEWLGQLGVRRAVGP